MRYPKTRYRRITINRFDGGLNTELHPAEIAPNEFSQFHNFVYDIGGFRLRGGFQIYDSFTKEIISCFLRNSKYYFVFKDGEFGVYDYSSKSYSAKGYLTVSVNPKFAWFDPFVCIATGDSLYLYDTSNDSLIKTDSKPAVDVLVKDGRVVIASGDEVWFSAVGDPTNWTSDSGDPSSAQFVQVGYKDGQPIVALSILQGQLVAFKWNSVWLVSMTDVEQVISGRGALNNSCVFSLGVDVYAVDKEGFYSVNNDRFLKVVSGNLDLKVKSFLKSNLSKQKTKLVYVPQLRAFLITGRDVNFLYFYQTKAFSTFETLLPVSGFFADDNAFFAFSSNIFEYKDSLPYDSFSGYIADDTQEIASDYSLIYEVQRINGTLKTKTFVFGGKATVLRFGIDVRDVKSDGFIGVVVDDRQENINVSPSSGYIYGDFNFISDDNSFIFGLPKDFNKHWHKIFVSDAIDVAVNTNTQFLLNSVFVDYSIMEG